MCAAQHSSDGRRARARSTPRAPARARAARADPIRPHALSSKSVNIARRRTTAVAGAVLGRRALKARQAVVRNRLPRRRRADPLAVFGADPGIGVERAHPHVDVLAVVRAAEQVPAALCAVPLRLPALRLPGAQRLLALLDRERRRRDARVRRRRCAGAALAVVAVAVARRFERSTDGEANGAAGTTTGQRLVVAPSLKG